MDLGIISLGSNTERYEPSGGMKMDVWDSRNASLLSFLPFYFPQPPFPKNGIGPFLFESLTDPIRFLFCRESLKKSGMRLWL